jgi:hypothetical protein
LFSLFLSLSLMHTHITHARSNSLTRTRFRTCSPYSPPPS